MVHTRHIRRNGGHLAQADSAVLQAVTDGFVRKLYLGGIAGGLMKKPDTVFPAVEPLLMDGDYDLAVGDERRCSIVTQIDAKMKL